MIDRTLLVCTFMGARSYIACEILKNKLGDGHQVFCSGFEAGMFPRLLRQVAAEHAVWMPAESPPTVFDRFSAGEHFDRVIALCGECSTEHCELFYASIREIYGRSSELTTWSVRDFAGVEGSQAEIVGEWHGIIGTIEAYCGQLAARLLEPVEQTGRKNPI